jgi:hypothetical protein
MNDNMHVQRHAPSALAKVRRISLEDKRRTPVSSSLAIPVCTPRTSPDTPRPGPPIKPLKREDRGELLGSAGPTDRRAIVRARTSLAVKSPIGWNRANHQKVMKSAHSSLRDFGGAERSTFH